MNPRFHHSKKTRHTQAVFWGGALAALLLLLSLFFPTMRTGLQRGIFITVVHPATKGEEFVRKRIDAAAAALKGRQSVARENDALEMRVAELELREHTHAVLELENERLLALLGRPESRDAILASVLVYPPDIAPDILIVDAGQEHNVRLEMRVITPDGVLLGRVSEVGLRHSRVTLVSATGNLESVIVAEAGLPVVAEGMGGANLQIVLPKTFELSSGMHIITSDTRPFFVGVVEEIAGDEASPSQILRFRLPVNIRRIREVMLVGE